MYLILYSKPGCHLCEGLLEKLEQTTLEFELEIRDITTQEDWFNLYQYEIPVLCQKVEGREVMIPRPSPRLSVSQLEKFLGKHLA